MYELWIGGNLLQVASTTKDIHKCWKKYKDADRLLRYVDAKGNVYEMDWSKVDDI